jgi:prepilin-type N-terminal cleavage/methylation domain-containing protein
MADRTQSNTQRNAGFTLAEMLVALSILSIGVTTLLAALSDSMSLRRSSDARLVAQEAVEDFVLRISQSGLRAAADATTPFDLELASGEPVALDGAPGMKIAAKTILKFCPTFPL